MNRIHTRGRLLGAVLVLGGCVVHASGQTKQPESDQPTDVLAGPVVREGREDRPSLVARDFDGRVRILDELPEEAALKMLTLTKSEQRGAQRILDRRARHLDDFVSNNTLLLTQLDTADKAGNKVAGLVLGLTAVDQLRPMLDDGPLEKQLRAVLEPANAERLSGLVREYEREAAADKRQSADADGKVPNRFEAAVATRAEGFMKEVERAYLRVESSGELAFRILFKGTNLTAEQSSRIRELLDLHQAKTKGNATEQENGMLFFAIAPLLRPEQQKRLMENIGGVSGKPQKSKEPTPGGKLNVKGQVDAKPSKRGGAGSMK